MAFLYFIVLVICNGLQLITEVKFVDTLVCFFPKHLSRTNRSLFFASFRFILYLMTPWVQLELKESWGQIPLLITELRGFCAPQAYYLQYISQEAIASRFSRLTKERTDLLFPVLFSGFVIQMYVSAGITRSYLSLLHQS